MDYQSVLKSFVKELLKFKAISNSKSFILLSMSPDTFYRITKDYENGINNKDDKLIKMIGVTVDENSKDLLWTYMQVLYIISKKIIVDGEKNYKFEVETNA